MRISRAVLTLTACLAIAPWLLEGGSLEAQTSTLPPKNLKKVGDHWTPWDPPEPGPGAYIIVKGDTLWDLSEKWLGDPFLWPQIWDENRYILDSHWIYPGDPLVIPGQPQVVPDKGPPIEESSTEPTEPEQTPEVPAKPMPPPLVAVADAGDIYCSGYIEPQHEPTGLSIAGHEENKKEHLATGDVIYLNQGRNQGIQPGDEFMIVRDSRAVEHPVTGDALGRFIRRLGKVRVMLAHNDTSTAVIEMACEDVVDGEELTLWNDIPVPRRSSMPPFERYDPTPSGGPTGYLVTFRDNTEIGGEGFIVYTDLGVASGVRPGDVLTLYEERPQLPRVKIGQAVVLTVEPQTSTAKITHSWRETEPGLRVEIAN